MDYHELLRKVEDQVDLFYREHTNANLFYHSKSHTKEVLENAKKIADHYQLDDRSFFIVCAAACFHDLGHIFKEETSYEAKSAALAEDFLRGIGAADADIALVKNCILVTEMPQKPESMLEKIVCDADLYNLGTSGFWDNYTLLKKEYEAVSNNKISGIAWRASTIEMLEKHHYHTDYGQLLLGKTKAENLAKLKDKQEKRIKKNQEAAAAEKAKVENPEVIVPVGEVVKVAKPKKQDRPLRGIETMFRISSSNSLRMSVMADNKAHIMISVNSIIISVVLGLVLKTLDENRNLLIPTIILLVVNVTTIIYSVIATRPKVAPGYFTPEQVANKSVNLLFFGSFYNMNYKEYEEGIKAMMADSEFLYGSLTKDIFWQGKVLGRKYRLLRTSYTIFLYGLIASVLAFSIASIFF